jgi:predicted alpha/beta hydrolase family esterase
MKQQVVAIHGGTSFDTYEDYIAFLKTRELTLERLKHFDDWKGWLGRHMGDSYEVLLPKMPNGTNACYFEWALWLERCLPFIQDNVILIGHSLGGIFLAKYLAEHDFPKAIKATILIAAPFNDTSTDESLTDFALPASLEKLVNQAGRIYLLHSKDDPVVPFEQVKQYEQMLPDAHAVLFEDKQHFNQETFPELATLIKSL